MSEDTCVACGAPVPEGRMVCPICEARAASAEPRFPVGSLVTLTKGGGWLYRVRSRPYELDGRMCVTATREAKSPSYRTPVILTIEDLVEAEK